MRRAFLSLYGLIVVSVIVIGWGLDRLWNTYFVDEPSYAAHTQLIEILADTLDRPAPKWNLNSHLNHQLELLPLGSFAQSNLRDEILLGRPVEVHQTADTTTYYQYLPRTETVMRVKIHTPSGSTSEIYYDLLLVVFYGSLALVVFLWMWPLSRDLAKLKKQTRFLGKEPVPAKLHIGPTSAIYDVATAFNRMSERIQELLASHKEMTYAVSHELRTPLARMKFALEIAAHQQDTSKMLEKLHSVRDDVSEMDDLVNQLLAYAGFEQGEQEMDFQYGDLVAMVEQLRARITHVKPTHNIDISIDSTIEENIRCEWCLMERAIVNIMLNAQRFAKHQIIVQLSSSSSHIHVAVHDDGPGIPISERDRVVQSFVRLNNHTNSQTRGFGLGLAIVNRVMTWHKGHVQISDSHLGGACVELIWPKQLP